MKILIRNPIDWLRSGWGLLLALLLSFPATWLNTVLGQATSLGTAFVYQGRLNDSGTPANGIYDLRFAIFASVEGGSEQGPVLTNTATGVSNGLFTAELDFGNQFDGIRLWLEIGVRTNGAGAFSTLSPRQALTPVPYAIYSPNAGTAAFALNATTATTANTAMIANGVGAVAATNVAQLNVPSTAIQATGTVTVFNGFVVGANLVNGGSGYTTAPAVAVADVSGSNAVVTSTVSNSAVVSLAIQTAGNNYTTNAVLVIAPPPNNAIQTFGAANNFTGVNTMTNSGNAFAGSFNGSFNGTFGDLYGGALTLSKNLYLPATSAAGGIIYSEGSTFLHASGTNNFFAGAAAGNLTLSGSGNVGVGYNALHNDTTGSGNTAGGFGALNSGTAAQECTAFGYLALQNNPASAMTAFGAHALENNNTGFSDTAFGWGALQFNTTGTNNTASGLQALRYNTTGSRNTAIGFDALFLNTIGIQNTASGSAALWQNTTGSDNTGDGYYALGSNTTGFQNTALGSLALRNSTSGNHNSAVGFQALLNTTGGSQNTANGAYALQNNTVGSNNIALGFQAGLNLTNGSGDIYIGSAGSGSDSGYIRIGTPGTHTNIFLAGIYGATVSAGVAVYVNSSGQLGTLTSSARFKTDIQPMDTASDVLLSLHPVTFRYRPEVDPQSALQFGLIAEEVDRVAPRLVARDDKGRPYTVRYEAVNAMLLNEFLKEHGEVEELKVRLEKLEQLLTGKTGDVNECATNSRARH